MAMKLALVKDKNSGIDREEIFIATKLWNDEHGYENTIKACNESLKKLQVSI